MKIWHSGCPVSENWSLLWFVIQQIYSLGKPASRSSSNAFVSGAVGLRFKSRAGQIKPSVTNGSPTLQHFFEKSCVAQAQWRGDGPTNSLHASAYYSEYNEKFDLIPLVSEITRQMVER